MFHNFYMIQKTKLVRYEAKSTLAISIMHYLKLRAISNFFPVSFSIYGLLPYKMSRCLELRYLELFAISN